MVEYAHQDKKAFEMNLLVSKRSWLLAPVLALVSIAALACTWAVMEPESLCAAFDADGASFFEILTLPFYVLIVPTVWLCCPFGGSLRRKVLLCTGVTCIAVMAVMKETDLHVAVISSMYPDVVANFRGTPFKMRFLTSGDVPLGAKFVSLMYFVLFFGVFAAMLLYYARTLIKAFFRLHPVAWSIACMGGSGVMVQIADRLPAWWRHSHDIAKADVSPAFTSFCTAFEEGGEMMLAAFALIAILQAHAIYAPDRPAEGLDV